MLGRVTAATQVAQRRLFSNGAAVAPAVDFTFIKRNMVDEASRTNVDRLEEAFNARVTAARSAPSPATIDWDAWAKALPQVDVPALKAKFEAYMAALPDITYDASSDAAAAAASAAEWQGIADYAAKRVSELEAIQAESEEHRLHDYYTVNRAFQRFDGLLEKEWAEWRDYNFESNLRTFTEVQDGLSADERTALVNAVAERAGVSPSRLA
jgi:hypothetical protein